MVEFGRPSKRTSQHVFLKKGSRHECLQTIDYLSDKSACNNRCISYDGDRDVTVATNDIEDPPIGR